MRLLNIGIDLLKPSSATKPSSSTRKSERSSKESREDAKELRSSRLNSAQKDALEVRELNLRRMSSGGLSTPSSIVRHNWAERPSLDQILKSIKERSQQFLDSQDAPRREDAMKLLG